MDSRTRYADYLDTLTALVTYLALTSWKSRTVAGLATDLSLRETDVQAACEQFPGVFRKSANRSPEGASYFTLHARYALRSAADEHDMPELRADLLKVILEFVASRAAAEQEQDRFTASLQHTRRHALWAAIAASVSAFAAVAAVVVSAVVH